ncbi:hypothetical protein ACHAWT_004410, partial [Skeletonema menzelii]
MDPSYIAIEFLCPVCNMLPINGAVLAEDGFLYDRGCVEQYFDNDHIRSPMTGQLMGKTLVKSTIVDDTVKRLAECEGLEPSFLKKKTADASINGTVSSDEIVALAQSYLFEEHHQSTDSDKSYFYQLVHGAAAKDYTHKVLQGICLIRGIGIERDWSEGFELLVDVASQEESSDAKNLALHTLGMCYERGVFGFKKSIVKGRKWLDRVESVPSFVTDYWDDTVEDPGDTLLFGDVNGRSTASTVTSLTTDLTERRCAECVRNDSFGLHCCICCKEKE